MSMSKVFICAAKRTAIGSMLGTLKNVHPADFAAVVVKQLLSDANIAAENIDELICGNVLPAGKGQGIGRQVAIKAGLPIEVPAYSLNMVCGSGMKAVINAYLSIQTGMNKVVIAVITIIIQNLKQKQLIKNEHTKTKRNYIKRLYGTI